MMRPLAMQLPLFPEAHPTVVPWLEPLSVQLLRAHHRARDRAKYDEIAQHFHESKRPLPRPPMLRVVRRAG